MHKVKNGKKLFAFVSAFVTLALIITLNFLDDGSYDLDGKSAQIWNSKKNNQKTALYVQLLNYDAVSQLVKARIYVVPPKKYAINLGSSVQAKVDTSMDISASTIKYRDSKNYGYWSADEFIRAIDIELDTDNLYVDARDSDDWFPFDQYSTTLIGNIRYLVEGSDTEDEADDVWESTAIGVLPYTTNLPGWSATFQYGAFEGESSKVTFEEGTFFKANIVLFRTTLNKVLLVLLSLIFIGGGLSMLLLFRAVLLSHRPPTLAGLVWAGSTAFTMIQTRTVIPGAPRIGVKFDLLIFYPALSMCFFSGGLMFYLWLTRENWSREL